MLEIYGKKKKRMKYGVLSRVLSDREKRGILYVASNCCATVKQIFYEADVNISYIFASHIIKYNICKSKSKNYSRLL